MRCLISDDFDLNVVLANDAQYAWAGGQILANSTDFNHLIVTKKLYEEFGHNICKQKFDSI